MNPARLLFLSFSLCSSFSSARAQDVRAQVWIHQIVDLHEHAYAKQGSFDAGYRADKAKNYYTAFNDFSGFSDANHDRLQGATSTDEKAFADWLKSRLKDLGAILDLRFRQAGGAGKQPSDSAVGNQEQLQPSTNDDNSQGATEYPVNQSYPQPQTNGDSSQGSNGYPVNQGYLQPQTNGDSWQGSGHHPANQGYPQPRTNGDPSQGSGSHPANQGYPQPQTNGDSSQGSGSHLANQGYAQPQTNGATAAYSQPSTNGSSTQRISGSYAAPRNPRPMTSDGSAQKLSSNHSPHSGSAVNSKNYSVESEKIPGHNHRTETQGSTATHIKTDVPHPLVVIPSLHSPVVIPLPHPPGSRTLTAPFSARPPSSHPPARPSSSHTPTHAPSPFLEPPRR